MIAVDTNVLLRRLLNDDEHQAKKASRIFNSSKIILITDVVLAETVWTLKGKRYNAQKEDIAAVVMSLLAEPNVVFESQQAVWSALNDYVQAQPIKTANGIKLADFADALIVSKAKITAAARQEHYEATYTFDQAALAIPGALHPKE
jgi:predicted nucleic-acid-binding protein